MHYKRYVRTGDPLKLNQQIYRGSEKDPLYTTWLNMRQRCSNKNTPQYKDWGGRGIKVCDRWNKDNGFSNFIKDMGVKPAGHSLDRIDVNGNYAPENCRWANIYTQQGNTRKATSHVGVSKCGDRWRARIGINNKEIWIGVFDDINEAIQARQQYK